MSDLPIPSSPDETGKPNGSRTAQPVTVTRNTPFEEIEPWHESVDLGTLLNEIADSIQRHIIAEKEVSHGTALWIAMTYLVDLFDTIALLIITAPEMRCGKSEFKRLIGKLVYRPVEADNMSPAVLFRCYDLWRPTLLVDEVDTFLKRNEELRGIINAGHQRGSAVWRCVGDNHVPSRFEVFGPKVLSGIGRLAPTLMDRAIILELRRKLPHESIVRQRDVPKEHFRNIQAKLARVAVDYASSISAARPNLPDALSDRARDNWEPLFQIAQVAGGEWVSRAVQASLKCTGKEEDAKSVGVALLTDIQEAFASKNVDRFSSSEIIILLCDDPENPWVTYNRGFPITTTQVARRLREYGIISKTIRVNGTTLKGYFLTQFADAFARYVFADKLEGTQSVTPSPAKSSDNAAVTSALPSTSPAVTCSANVDVGCDGVTGSAVDEANSPASTNAPGVLAAEKRARTVAAARAAVQSALGLNCSAAASSLAGTAENLSVPTVAPVTPASVTGNGDVTCSTNVDMGCDSVTADTGTGATYQ